MHEGRKGRTFNCGTSLQKESCVFKSPGGHLPLVRLIPKSDKFCLNNRECKFVTRNTLFRRMLPVASLEHGRQHHVDDELRDLGCCRGLRIGRSP